MNLSGTIRLIGVASRVATIGISSLRILPTTTIATLKQVHRCHLVEFVLFYFSGTTKQTLFAGKLKQTKELCSSNKQANYMINCETLKEYTATIMEAKSNNAVDAEQFKIVV